ncbi:MAG: Ig-like domain-containing protein, partial [Planctomycetota bacterium]
MRRSLLCEIAGLLSLALVAMTCNLAGGADFYVATSGNDAWSGKLAGPTADGSDGPFATLERARDEVRRLKQAGAWPQSGVTVTVRGGVYERSQTFQLSAQDSGTQDAPVVYRARKGEQVRLVGGKVLAGFRPVTDPPVLSRLDPAARGNVLRVDLKAAGINDLGEVAASGKRLALFF